MSDITGPVGGGPDRGLRKVGANSATAKAMEAGLLELRPNCELCDCDLPPDSVDARICTYECTYCATCVETVLRNVCATCGGGFTPRPIRPWKAWRPDKRLGLGYHPASAVRHHTPFTLDDIKAHVDRIKGVAPRDR